MTLILYTSKWYIDTPTNVMFKHNYSCNFIFIENLKNLLIDVGIIIYNNDLYLQEWRHSTIEVASTKYPWHKTHTR